MHECRPENVRFIRGGRSEKQQVLRAGWDSHNGIYIIARYRAATFITFADSDGDNKSKVLNNKIT